jgi:hypothetical protein
MMVANGGTMTRADRDRWARIGAETALGRLEAERQAIYREFPDLRSMRNIAPTRRRRRRRMSVVARKAQSVRMKKFWAERRRRALAKPA